MVSVVATRLIGFNGILFPALKRLATGISLPSDDQLQRPLHDHNLWRHGTRRLLENCRTSSIAAMQPPFDILQHKLLGQLS